MGNVTYLRTGGDVVVAALEFDPDEVDAESIGVDAFLLLLAQWRQRVIARGGVSGPEAAELVEAPTPRPMGPAT